MITTIQIRDFRGIHTGLLKGLRQVNLLVGPNNSGKSTLMEALYLACAVGRPAGLTIPNEPPQFYDVKLAAADLSGQHPQIRLWQRHNYARKQAGLGEWNQLRGDIQVRLRDESLPFSSFELATGGRGFAEGEERSTAVFALEPQPDNDDQPIPPSLFAEMLLGSSPDPFEQARLLFCWHPDLTYYYKGSAAWLTRGQAASAANTLFFDATAVQNHIPLAFYERMLSVVPGWTQQIGRHFGRIFELDTPFAVQFLPTGPDRQQIQGWIAPEDRPAIPIDAFGDGSRAAFKLLTFLTALAAKVTPDAPGVLFWEEPESFQNPQTLARLLREVITIIRDKPIQLFMASHSLELAAHLTTMLQKQELSPESALVFRLNLQDGALRSSWFDADNLTTWLETGLDPRVWGDFVAPYQFYLVESEV